MNQKPSSSRRSIRPPTTMELVFLTINAVLLMITLFFAFLAFTNHTNQEKKRVFETSAFSSESEKRSL